MDAEKICKRVSEWWLSGYDNGIQIIDIYRSSCQEYLNYFHHITNLLASYFSY